LSSFFSSRWKAISVEKGEEGERQEKDRRQEKGERQRCRRRGGIPLLLWHSPLAIFSDCTLKLDGCSLNGVDYVEFLCNIIQEMLVMRNGDHTSLKALQSNDESVDGFHVQVICGLIKNKEMRF
jgi:hypothetical protein